jgi:hypothetical protein
LYWAALGSKAVLTFSLELAMKSLRLIELAVKFYLLAMRGGGGYGEPYVND